MKSPKYSVVIDGIDKPEWDHLIMQFDDASFYQTWSCGAAFKTNLSHILIRQGDKIHSCCQVALKHSSFPRIGIADIKWGPLFITKGEVAEPNAMAYIIRAIKEEYSVKRGYLVRIEPRVTGACKESLKGILERQGFMRNPSTRPYRTFLIDLTPSLDQLRGNLLQKWRNCLNKAERSGLKVIEGTSDSFFQSFLGLAKEMIDRKNLDPEYLLYYSRIRSIQKKLPDHLKMNILLALHENEPVSSAIYTAIGNTGIYLLGATNRSGLKYNGAYLLQWHMIRQLKERGQHYYDLGAFNPQRNPGVYHFKAGVAGKNGHEEIFLGEYFGCFNISAKIVKYFFSFSRFLRDARKYFGTIYR